jgi:hypothetical protein
VVTAQQEKLNLRAVLYAVRVGGREIVTGSVGESMTGVPAKPDMYSATGRSPRSTCRRCCCWWTRASSSPDQADTRPDRSNVLGHYI